MHTHTSQQSTARAPWSCALPNLWEPSTAGVSARRCSCGACHAARAGNRTPRAGSGISLWGLDAECPGDKMGSILGWNGLHGCPANFAGVFAPYEKMTQQGIRQEQRENPEKKDKESRQVRASWKAAVRQRKGRTLCLLSPGAIGARAASTDGRGNDAGPCFQACPSFQVSKADPTTKDG